MTVTEAKRLKALQDENAKLNKLLSEQMPKSRPVCHGGVGLNRAGFAGGSNS